MPRILIVEDSATQAKQLEAMLSRYGYDVSIAYSAKEALEFLQKTRPDLVITDILMPETDGFELCRQIKTSPSLKSTTVVLLTQLSDPREVIRGLACGADDFIVKPYNEDLLLSRIKTILLLRKKESEKEFSILVVEDSPTQAEQLRFLLEKHNFIVTIAVNGQEALVAAKRSRPSLIISDILMPVMNGYELASEIKKDSALKSVPIILITTLADGQDLLKRAAVVADGYFTKPYDDNYLLNKVENLLISANYADGILADPLEISFAGERYSIASGRRQILTFLLSTYENAVHQNQDLLLMQRELQMNNEQLEERVSQRTLQLQASEAKYRTLLENSADAMLVIGTGNVIYFANQAALHLFWKKSHDIIGHPFEYASASGEMRDIEIIRPDGQKVIAEMRLSGTMWGSEKANLATLRDITERKRIENALRESEENFRALSDNANDSILIMTEEGRLAYVNKRTAELTGYSVKELMDAGIDAIEKTEDGIFTLTEVITNEDGRVQHETIIKGKGQQTIPVEVTSSKTTWHGVEAAIVIIRDISERKKREADIIRASKLESIGTLAGGIAHDFNNLLTGIVGNVSLARLIVGKENKAHKILEDMEKAALRAKDLTRQLLTFSKGGAPVKKTTSLANIIKESASFIASGSGARCDFSIADNLLMIEADEGQIGQVMHNLVLNAMQSMKEVGVVKITAENRLVVPSDKLPVKDGRYVRITVADTGSGISPENTARIFDPYFTTKEDGSGLGLATVYSIIRNHQGYITFESEAGRGTTFTIYLPAIETIQRKSVRPVDANEGPVYGKGRILIMDDEEIVREAATEILSVLGYEIECAASGEDTLRLYARAMQEGKPFGLVLMDLTIPGAMGGKETIKKLLEIDPKAKAIVSSGYSADAIMSEYLRYGFSAVIAKPYRITDLSKVIARVMHEK